ncbi:SpoIIE family protein phosphatase, partial [Streptomyces sp. SL13]
GDVCGKGPQAAAVTSLTRYTLRAAALHNPDPVEVLTTLNTVLNQRYSSGDTRYCTAIHGTLIRRDFGFAVDLASGGHPLAPVRRSDGGAPPGPLDSFRDGLCDDTALLGLGMPAPGLTDDDLA